MEKSEIAQNEQFHLFPQCFLCILRSFNRHISVTVVVYSLIEVGTVSKWCSREWVKRTCIMTNESTDLRQHAQSAPPDVNRNLVLFIIFLAGQRTVLPHESVIRQRNWILFVGWLY